MPTLKRRVLFTSAAALFAAACGTLAGYLLACEITQRVTENRLEQYASRMVDDGEGSASELRTVLAAVGASNKDFCSAKEIAYFRSLIFESEDLKDVGRMRDGKVVCSADLGKLPLPLVQVAPYLTQWDGTRIFQDLPVYKDRSLPTLALQLDESYVVYTPMTRMHIESAPMHFTETVTDAPTQKPRRLLGESPGNGVPVFTTEGVTRLGNSIYATKCSIRFFNCVTAYTSIPEIVAENRAKFDGCVALFGVLGAFTGVIFSLLYRRNKSVEQQLRRAIRRDKLRVFYQPIVNLKSRRIVGAEALVRWTDEEGVMVRPDIFVRIAEERGFAGKIAELVVRHVLRDFATVLRANPDFRISVNVTASDLGDPAFLPMLQDSLNRTGVQASSLAIELTESSTARNPVVIETILRLRQSGHSVHIDDFGTGYSSLSYLHELSVDAIKIDRSFTQAIGTDSVMVCIVPQILGIAEALDLEVIVEGIETVEQADYFASTNRILLAQGWLFGRPTPSNDFQIVWNENRKSKVPPANAA